MSSPNDVWTGEIRQGEHVVSFGRPLEGLKGGDLIPYRKSAYGFGTCQMLFVAYIDGYGTEHPYTWRVYVLPETEVQLYHYDRDFYEVSNMYVRLNTWAEARDRGAVVPESEARLIFNWLDDLPYDV